MAQARGNSQRHSDLDLLAVVKKYSWSAFEKMFNDVFEIIARYGYELVVSLIVLDSDEFALEQKQMTCFFKISSERGLIYGRSAKD